MTEVGRATLIIDADDSRLQAGLAKAKQDATAGVAGIEQNLRGQMSGGISGALSGKNWKQAGMSIGADLVQGVTAPLGALGDIAGSTALAMGPVGIAAVAGVAAAGALGVASSRAAMEWEAGMSQISKTTGIEKGTEAFNELDSSLTNLYSRMPTTVAEIQSVAAAAGSLGIEKDSIAGFTEVALQMGSAFDMPAEEAAVAVGKIKSQLKSLPEGVQTSEEFARQFGSAVDYVGNEFNATEIAMQTLRERGWLTEHEIKSSGKGRPLKTYALRATIDEIINYCEAEKSIEAARISEAFQKLKDLSSE